MLCKCVEPTTRKNTQNIDFNRKLVCSFKKIVLRIFYIEYLSTFGGDFAPIVPNAAVLSHCKTMFFSQFNAQPHYLSLVSADNLNIRQSLQRGILASLAVSSWDMKFAAKIVCEIISKCAVGRIFYL